MTQPLISRVVNGLLDALVGLLHFEESSELTSQPRDLENTTLPQMGECQGEGFQHQR